MSSTTDRLDALEAENARLSVELAALKGDAAPAPAPPVAPQPAAYIEPCVAVRQVSLLSGLVMPSDDELRALYAIVSKAHSKLVRPASRGESQGVPFNEFVAAFVALGNLGRTPQLDGKHSLGWWTDHAIYAAPGANGQRAFDGAAFMLAALAHGDVPYRAWSESSPVEFGLLPYSGQGTPAGDAWRSVLARGHINPPAAPAREPIDYRTGRMSVGPDRLAFSPADVPDEDL